jgi:hypothetical protein
MAGKAWIVLNGQQQLRRRLVKPAFEEIGLSHRDQWGTHTLARAQAQRGLEVLDREVRLTGKYPDDTAQIPAAGEARVERERAVDQADNRTDILPELSQH